MARFLLVVFTFVVLGAYGTAAGVEGAKVLRSPTPAPTRTPASPSPTPAPTSAPVKSSTARGPSRVFGHVGGVALLLPAERVEMVGFHQASDINSLNMTPAAGTVRLPSRHRPTSRHTAADIVVHPQSEIYAPVSGVVKRAGDYLLYCKHPDAFAVISPDGHPELEVKMLHISGRRVRPGDRVVAGETLIAKRPTKLPFASQVDTFVGPQWPHVHMEVTKLDVPSTTPVVGPLATGLAFSQCG